MDVKMIYKFIEIKYYVSNWFVIFITNYRRLRILEIAGVWHGSRLTVSSLHGLPFRQNPRPKRRVATLGDQYSVPQSSGPFSPAYRYPPTVNGWLSICEVSTDCEIGERLVHSIPGPARGYV